MWFGNRPGYIRVMYVVVKVWYKLKFHQSNSGSCPPILVKLDIYICTLVSPLQTCVGLRNIPPSTWKDILTDSLNAHAYQHTHDTYETNSQRICLLEMPKTILNVLAAFIDCTLLCILITQETNQVINCVWLTFLKRPWYDMFWPC